MPIDPEQLVVVAAPYTGASAAARTLRRRTGQNLLVVRGPRPPEGFRKIMIAMDRRAHVTDAIALAIELARPGAEVELVHAWLLPGMLGHGLEGAGAAPLVAAAQDAALRRGERIAAANASPGVHLVARAIDGPPAAALIRHAVEGQFDLIVIPRHRHRHVTSRVLGSVADALLERAPCSVLIAGRR